MVSLCGGRHLGVGWFNVARSGLCWAWRRLGMLSVGSVLEGSLRFELCFEDLYDGVSVVYLLSQAYQLSF